MIARRALLLAVAAAIGAFAPVAQAQVPHIGILALFSCDRGQPFYAAMRELGYVEGRTVEYDCVPVQGRLAEADALAAAMVARRPSLIVTSSTPMILAVQRATTTIPIVMQFSADAVREGLVRSLARPGGNTTGLTSVTVDLLGKRLELAREILPHAARLALLSRSDGPGEFMSAFLPEFERVAAQVGFAVRHYRARDAAAAPSVMDEMVRDGADLLYVVEGPAFTGPRATEVARAALERRLPTIGAPGHARAGALFSYFPDPAGASQRVARYVDRILRGADPGELPIEQPTRFELVLNLKTARALGIEIPVSVLARADEVIE